MIQGASSLKAALKYILAHPVNLQTQQKTRKSYIGILLEDMLTFSPKLGLKVTLR